MFGLKLTSVVLLLSLAVASFAIGVSSCPPLLPSLTYILQGAGYSSREPRRSSQGSPRQLNGFHGPGSSQSGESPTRLSFSLTLLIVVPSQSLPAPALPRLSDRVVVCQFVSNTADVLTIATAIVRSTLKRPPSLRLHLSCHLSPLFHHRP